MTGRGQAPFPVAAWAILAAFTASPSVGAGDGKAVAASAELVRPAADDALAQLSRRLAGRLQVPLRDPCLGNARTAVLVRDLGTGAVLFTREAETPLTPASNQKLLTGAAAQALLGPEFTLRTEFRAERRPNAAGAVGNLHVVGGGDPTVTVETLYGMARSLAAAGVRQVAAVIADDSFLEGPGRVPSWPQRNHPFWYGAPAGALNAHFNVVAVHARGHAQGEGADTWVDPFPSFFELQSEVRAGHGAWAIRSLALPQGEGTAGQRLVATGRVPRGRTQRELRAVEDPGLFFAHGLVESLQRVGVEVAGPIRRGRAPADSVLLHAHRSRPLSSIVQDMNKESSNVFAEALLMVLGAHLLGAPGTREKGLAVLRAWLDTVTLEAPRCRLADGSGLSPENALTARAITDVLMAAHADPYIQLEYLVSLPVGGIDGTLRRRLANSSAVRLVRAKTGRLGHVVSLSGLARVEDGRDAVFSILVNNHPCPSWKAQELVDQLVLALVAEATPAPELRSRIRLEGLEEAVHVAIQSGDEADVEPPTEGGD